MATTTAPVGYTKERLNNQAFSLVFNPVQTSANLSTPKKTQSASIRTVARENGCRYALRIVDDNQVFYNLAPKGGVSFGVQLEEFFADEENTKLSVAGEALWIIIPLDSKIYFAYLENGQQVALEQVFVYERAREKWAEIESSSVRMLWCKGGKLADSLNLPAKAVIPDFLPVIKGRKMPNHYRYVPLWILMTQHRLWHPGVLWYLLPLVIAVVATVGWQTQIRQQAQEVALAAEKRIKLRAEQARKDKQETLKAGEASYDAADNLVRFIPYYRGAERLVSDGVSRVVWDDNEIRVFGAAELYPNLAAGIDGNEGWAFSLTDQGWILNAIVNFTRNPEQVKEQGAVVRPLLFESADAALGILAIDKVNEGTDFEVVKFSVKITAAIPTALAKLAEVMRDRPFSLEGVSCTFTGERACIIIGTTKYRR